MGGAHAVNDKIILHLSAAGVPTFWSLTAVYGSSYGIACNAAKSWSDKQVSPELVIEVERGAVTRKDLFWPPEEQHRDRQNPDDFVHVQWGRIQPALLDEALQTLVQETVRAMLVECGYLIPRAEWERRYPASALTSRRFSEFNAAHQAARDAGEEFVFVDRWVPFMEPPKGWKTALDVKPRGKEFGLVPRRAGAVDPTGGVTWPDRDQAETAMRLLNSGWTWEEVQILMTPEPVEAAA